MHKFPSTDHALARRIASQHWTSHNIRFTPEVTTLPGQADFLETDGRVRALLQVLDHFYPRDLSGLRIADLGCLEGGYCLALAQRGAQVLGIDVRQQNIDKCLTLKEHFGLSNLQFALDDVKSFTAERYGTFDVVIAFGILYHLDDPVAWLRQLHAATRGLLLIDTHYAPEAGSDLAGLSPGIAYKLGPITERGAGSAAYRGRWFHEYPAQESTPPVVRLLKQALGGVYWRLNRERRLWASYSNMNSFWLTKESLIRAIADAGFDLVDELFREVDGQIRPCPDDSFRSIFLASNRASFPADVLEDQLPRAARVGFGPPQLPHAGVAGLLTTPA